MNTQGCEEDEADEQDDEMDGQEDEELDVCLILSLTIDIYNP